MSGAGIAHFFTRPVSGSRGARNAGRNCGERWIAQLVVALELALELALQAAVGVEPRDLVLVLVRHQLEVGSGRRRARGRRGRRRARARARRRARRARGSARAYAAFWYAVRSSTRRATSSSSVSARRSARAPPCSSGRAAASTAARSCAASRPHANARWFHSDRAAVELDRALERRRATTGTRPALERVAEQEEVRRDRVAEQRRREPRRGEEVRRVRRRPRARIVVLHRVGPEVEVGPRSRSPRSARRPCSRPRCVRPAPRLRQVLGAGRDDEVAARAADRALPAAMRVAWSCAGSRAMRTWLETAPFFCARPVTSSSEQPLPSRCAATARIAPTVTTPVPPIPVDEHVEGPRRVARRAGSGSAAKRAASAAAPSRLAFRTLAADDGDEARAVALEAGVVLVARATG